MGNCDFTRVFSAAVGTNRGCGMRGITCYGNARMFSVIEEVNIIYDDRGICSPYPHRLVRSADNGATWEIFGTYNSRWNIWFWRQLSPQTNRILVGNEGPDQGFYNTDDNGDLIPESYYTTDMPLAVSDDGGFSWVDAAPGFVDSSSTSEDYWDSEGFIQCAGGTVFAYGYFWVRGTVYTLLRSTDNGRVFASQPADQMSVSSRAGNEICCGCYCGNDIALLGELRRWPEVSVPPTIWRSVDNGATWSSVALPTNEYPPSGTDPGGVTGMAFLGNHTILASGGQYWGLGKAARLWRSLDDGATWTEITSVLPAYGGLGLWVGSPLVSWGDGLHAIMPGPPVYTAYPIAYFTEDAGSTWNACDMLPAGRSEVCSPCDFGVADDGSICYTVNTDTVGSEYQIWRAVPTWTVPGPCWQVTPPIPPAPHNYPRVPSNHPWVTCPQECE